MATAEKKVRKSASEVKKVAKKRKYKKAVSAAKAKKLNQKRSWNFINSWKYGNKKERYDVTIRIGTFTLFETYYCPCDRNGCKRFRLMLFNFGVEI